MRVHRITLAVISAIEEFHSNFCYVMLIYSLFFSITARREVDLCEAFTSAVIDDRIGYGGLGQFKWLRYQQKIGI